VDEKGQFQITDQRLKKIDPRDWEEFDLDELVTYLATPQIKNELLLGCRRSLLWKETVIMKTY